MIEAIVISLSILLLVAYKTLGRNLSRPSVLYIGGFLICSIVAYNWKEEWGLEQMEFGTAFMIIGGALFFYLVEWHDYKKHPISSYIEQVEEMPHLNISSVRLILFFCFQLLSFYMMAKAKMTYAATDELSDALVQINDEEKFEDTHVTLPGYVTHPYYFCRIVGYIWCVLLPYYQFASSDYNKEKVLIALNFITCLCGVILSGGRMGILNYLISYICFFYISYQFKNHWKGGFFPKKIMIGILLVGVFFGLFFQNIGYAIGRKEDDKTTNMIFAIYCGAQIKNLDDYIHAPWKQDNSENLLGQYTISNVYNRIAQKQGSRQSRQFSAELPFNHYGQYPLGNVYSAYYNYYADFGYWGILCAGGMAFILALLYRKTLKSNFWETGRLNFWILFYSWLLSSAFLCFFANQFWGGLTIVDPIKNMIVWWVMIYYLQGKDNNIVVRQNMDDITTENLKDA